MFPRKTTMLLLLATILLALAIRYPMVEHERFETDSYFIHGLSDSIASQGRAVWTFNALSYFGYYPFSYPSGAPFVLAELSVLTGLGVDVCILIADGVLASLFCLVVFLLSREFVHRAGLSVLAALLASLAPRFVDTTYWVGSARGMEVVLMTLLVLAAFRSSFTRNNRLLAVSLAIGIGCFAAHHMAVLIILFGVGYVVSDLVVRYLPRMFIVRGRRLAITAIALMGVISAIAILNYYEFLGNSLESIGEGGFFSFNIPIASVLGNLVVSYTHQIGLVLFLAALGVVAFLRAPRFSAKGVFPFAVLLAFVPVLGSSLYVSMLLAPFVAIAAALWIQGQQRRGRTRMKATQSLVAVLIVASLMVTLWSVDRWNDAAQPSGDMVRVSDSVFNDAAYLKWNGGSHYTLSNAEPLTAQLWAYSGSRFFESGIQATINGDITEQDIERNITPSTTPFPGNLYTWLVYKDDLMISRYVYALMVSGVDVARGSSNDVFHLYAISHPNVLVVVDNNWPSQYASSYGTEHASLPGQLRNCQVHNSANTTLSSYCTYQSQRVTIYMVQLPTE